MKSISLFKDKIFKNNIAKNFLVVFLGDGFSSVLTLLNLSIMIKVLGLNESSIVNLVISYTLVFDTIFNFQSFNSIIRFLPRALIDKDFLKVKGYLQQGFILDIVTALISFFAANLFLEFIWNIFKRDRDIVNLIRVYSFSILSDFEPSMFNGMPTTIMEISYSFIISSSLANTDLSFPLFIIVSSPCAVIPSSSVIAVPTLVSP